MLQREAEVGIIERVSVKNFLCHSIQDVKMGPRVNFIIGGNGSKSHFDILIYIRKSILVVIFVALLNMEGKRM